MAVSDFHHSHLLSPTGTFTFESATTGSGGDFNMLARGYVLDLVFAGHSANCHRSQRLSSARFSIPRGPRLSSQQVRRMFRHPRHHGLPPWHRSTFPIVAALSEAHRLTSTETAPAAISRRTQAEILPLVIRR